MVYLALLVAGGLVLGLFESMIALPVPIVGAKLGISNIVVLTALVLYGFKDGLLVAILKSLLLMLVTGAVSSFIFSFVGTILSLFSMYLALKYLKKSLSLIGVSLIGASFHNFGQVLCASLILRTTLIFAYLPILLIIGIFTGFFVGLSTIYLTKNLMINLGSI